MSSTTNSAPAQVQLQNWRPRNTKTLRGFFSAVLPSGMIINDLMLHEGKKQARWIGLPAREYKDSQGERKFAPVIEFIDDETGTRFSRTMVAALDAYFAKEQR